MSAVSKVIYGNTTVIDITDSTVNANNLLSGEKAYGADGEPVIGALTMGSTINVTAVDSSFYGETLSLTNGITTLSTTFDNSGDATFTSVIMTGLLTLTSNGLSQQISIPSYGTYNITFDPVPEGATVTPTDDIQLWLRCAHITDKSYTTLAEVLADRATFETLIADSNACDYMARSTTWAGNPNGDVPQMTSPTTPSGVASESTTYDQSTYGGWQVFNDTSGYYDTSAGNYNNQWISYTFTEPKNIVKVSIKANPRSGNETVSTSIATQVKVNNEWITLDTYSNNTQPIDVVRTFENQYSSTDYRIYFSGAWYSSRAYVMYDRVQFYGLGITLDADAMALIGKYDYCCNALLGNATWAEAIANSDYFEEVLNVKVPNMTSNTTPSGECFGSSLWDANNTQYYKAFDGNTSDGWLSLNQVNAYVGYKFTSKVKVLKAVVNNYTYDSYGYVRLHNFKIQGSNDNFVSDINDLATDEYPNQQSGLYAVTFSNNSEYQYYRLYIIDSYGGYIGAKDIQFYGRASKKVLVPLVPTMTSNTTPSGVASADSIYGTGYEAYRAFDNAVSTTDAWVSGSVASSYNYPHWIQYQFPTAQVVGGLHFKNYSTGSNGVKTFKVQGSNDGTTWTDLYSGTGTNAGGGTLQEFYFDNTTAYLYYRLYITEGHSAIECGICYLQFLRTQSLTNIIHSCANDTIYYYENGSPIIIATTNSSGIGICDFSLLDDKVYTLYSTVAKDPSNLSNPYSKQVRITKSSYGGTTELYLMPDTVKTLYWWGYENNLEDISTTNGWTAVSGWSYQIATHSTNKIPINPNGNSNIQGVGSKTAINCETVYAICNGIQGNPIGWFGLPNSKEWTSTYRNTVSNGTVLGTYSRETKGNYYAYAGAIMTAKFDLLALWYE